MNRIYILVALLIFFAAPFNISSQEFSKVSPGKTLSFPRDHGVHKNYPTEWWYFTGHLEDKKHRTFGFELTFFRIGVNPDSRDSKWHIQSLYMAHFALTNDSGKRFYFSESMSRSSKASEGDLDIAIDEYRIKRAENGVFLLEAQAVDKQSGVEFTLNLSLSSNAKPVLHGDNGFSAKGPKEGQASYYYSLPRLLGSGNISIGPESFQVNASAWMDHEVVSFDADAKDIGWDWFAVQFDDGGELMLFYLYGEDGVPTEYSSGTYIDNGRIRHLKKSDFSIKSTSEWESPQSGIKYPASWEIAVPTEKLSFSVKPTVNNQEIRSTKTTGVTYWEGRAKVLGKRSEKEVSGSAYVELVGYK